MEHATENSVYIIGKLKSQIDNGQIDLNSNSNINEFIQNIYLLGYNNGRASIIKGGDKVWKDKIFPNIQKNDYDEICIILNNILSGIFEEKKKNSFLTF